MTITDPAVAVLDPSAKLGLRTGKLLRNLQLDQLRWPLGRPARLAGGRVADLGPEDHLIGFPQNLSLRWPEWGLAAKVSIVLAEPKAIHGNYQARVLRNATRFHRVLSYNRDLLDQIPNGIFFPYGSTWVPDWQTRDMTKSAMCSLIASSKRSQEGHALRHAIAGWVQKEGMDVTLLGQAYAPFKDKADGLAPYRYSVVIENVREENCFTEKLIDAVLCQTVPIYWGCPNVDDFLDTSGMIICQSRFELEQAIGSMSKDDYAIRLPHLRNTQAKAARYGDFFERAARAVAEDRPVP